LKKVFFSFLLREKEDQPGLISPTFLPNFLSRSFFGKMAVGK